MRQKRFAAVLSAVLLLLAVVASGTFRSNPAGDGVVSAQGSPGTRGVAVEVSPAQTRKLELHVTYHGALRPSRTVQLSLATGGRVAELPVEVGQRVAQGDALLRLETRELEAQLRQAEAGLASARAGLERLLNGASADELAQVRAAVSQAEVQVENARSEFERNEHLYQGGSISRQAYDAARSQVQIAESQLTSVRAQLAQLQRGATAEDLAMAEAQLHQAQAGVDLVAAQLDHAVLRSAIDGVVSRRGIEVGEMASPGTPLFTVVDLSELVMAVRAPGRDVIRLTPEMPVQVVVEDMPSHTLTGRVHRIDPVADPTTNLFSVELRVPNADGELRAGFYASARLTVVSIPNALVVPERAITLWDGQDGVYIVENDRAVFRPLEFGVSDGSWREVLSGDIAAGTPVITTGKEYISPNAMVRVRR